MRYFYLTIAFAACILLTGCAGKSGRQSSDGSSVDTEIEEIAIEAEDISDIPQSVLYPQLDQAFTVDGTPSVQSFVEALPVYNAEYGWDVEPDIDLKNGYFHFSQEGDGGVSYYGCVWKRDDGSRLFIFSYRETGWNEYEGRTESFTRFSGSPWFYSSAESYLVGENQDEITFYDYDTGFAAYIYNEDAHTLEPLSEPPVNGWKAREVHRLLLLPRKGKDIEVQEGVGEDSISYTLKWNGMTFDL